MEGATPPERDNVARIEPTLEASARSLASGSALPTTPGPVATRLGRYIILDLLGSGGMGLVYSAFDPQLDRRVAVKVLRMDVGDAADRQRLLREAKAMARLAHPNVVVVYDAGEEGGQTYVAMEFVRGSSLRRWLAEPHGWQEIVAVFLQAGSGLQAAHEVGLVHRDFKPKKRSPAPNASLTPGRSQSHELGRFERVRGTRVVPE